MSFQCWKMLFLCFGKFEELLIPFTSGFHVGFELCKWSLGVGKIFLHCVKLWEPWSATMWWWWRKLWQFRIFHGIFSETFQVHRRGWCSPICIWKHQKYFLPPSNAADCPASPRCLVNSNHSTRLSSHAMKKWICESIIGGAWGGGDERNSSIEMCFGIISQFYFFILVIYGFKSISACVEMMCVGRWTPSGWNENRKLESVQFRFTLCLPNFLDISVSRLQKEDKSVHSHQSRWTLGENNYVLKVTLGLIKSNQFWGRRVYFWFAPNIKRLNPQAAGKILSLEQTLG